MLPTAPTTVADLLADPARWTPGSYSRTADGDLAWNDSPAGVWTLDEAIAHVYGRRHTLVPDRKILDLIGAGHTLQGWNHGHTHAEVLALVQRAGI